MVRLDRETLDACLRDLNRCGKPDDVEGLYGRLLCRGYCAFGEEALLAALDGDGRFVVSGDGEITISASGPGGRRS